MSALIKKSGTIKNSSLGFTLVEMAIVIMLVGVAIAGLAPLYSQYQNSQKINNTDARVNLISNAVGNFRSLYGRYPCPASLTLNRTDPRYGREDCTNMLATPVGNCANGICIEQSTRILPTYTYPGGVVRNNQAPRVKVGFVPFRQLNIEENLAYDGYGDRIMYVVTEHLTCDTCFQNNQGGIDVIDDSGTTVLAPTAATAHFLVMSYGENNSGAYTRAGTQIPCVAGAGNAENENCDYNSSAANADATYRLSRIDSSNNATRFDDKMTYFTQDEIPLWQMSTNTNPAARFSIVQKATGDVAVRQTPNLIGQKGDIGGTVRANTDPAAGTPTGQFRTSQLCDMIGGNCFSTDLISGRLSDPVGGLKCPEDDTTGPTGPYMVGIANNQPICTNAIVKECPTGTLMTGVNPDGTIRCNTAPPDNCVGTTVTLCTGITSAIPAGNHGSSYTVTAGTSMRQTYTCNDGSWVPTGPSTGVCNCTPGVTSTSTVPCNVGFTGTQTVTVTMVCPAGTTTTTTNAASCVCDATRQTSTRSCPTGHTGNILTERFHQCPGATWGPWTDVPNGNTCSCSNSRETRNVSCPAGLSGNITEERALTCTSNGVTVGPWYEIANTCACNPTTETSPFPCPSGYTGSIMKKRTLQCPAGTWTAWVDVPGGNTCAAIPPVVCKWTAVNSGTGPSGSATGRRRGTVCNVGSGRCGDVRDCFDGTNTTGFINYKNCQCR